MTNDEARALVEKALANHPAVVAPKTLEVEDAGTHVRVHGEGVELNVWPNGGLVGTARVDRLAAYIRLLAYVVLALVSAWGAMPLIVVGVLISGVPLKWMGQLGLVNASVTTAVSLGIALWLSVRFSEWVGTLKPSFFDEPLSTVTEGVARWPAPQGLDELLQRSRQLLIPLGVTLGLVLLTDLFGLNPRAVGLDLCSIALCAVVWRQTKTWAAPTPGVTTKTVKAGGEWGELMLTALDGARLSLIVTVFSYGIRISGVLSRFAAATHVTHFAVSALLDSALKLAVIISVVRARPSDVRTLTVVSLVGSLVGERLFGDAGRLAFIALGVFLTLRQALKHSTRDALRQTARFELTLAVGRIVGVAVAALFLGVFGMELGEALGEQVAALLAASRIEPVVTDKHRTPPLSNASVRWVTGAALVIAGLFALRPWNRDSGVAPKEWPLLQGDGWSVRWPSAKQEWKPEPDGRSTETTWNGTRFYVREVREQLSDPSDRTGFMAMNHLFNIRGVGCSDLNLGVVGDQLVRCVAARPPRGRFDVTLACAFTPLTSRGYADGERAFLKSFGDSLGRTQQGVTLEECDGYSGMYLDMRHKLDALTR